ncbi:50S ribosomal protein L25/general stress protein Ctc [Oceanospirillum maris]|jgi:large subunit ribosomal protein L25|uniref:50S ribosomal protein L25/general stress protein Ctc n=1 Tax=Oceanospirillum maris TaxID=64977 RepID=UPI00040FD0E1|nr:50S ribosomal protein L25/general stress protein Ctc [Oceanospirillum maris]
MTDFTLNAVVRSDKGKGASRRLRRLEASTPAIVYGLGKEPVSLSLEMRELFKKLENEGFYTHIIELNIEGADNEKVILKDLQRHPFKDVILHADFLRVDESCKVSINIPVHFANEAACKGVKVEGGALMRLLTEVEISALPSQMPESINVDVTDLGKGQTIHLSDLTLPAGVEIVALSKGADHNDGVVSVVAPKGAAAEEEAGEE